MIGTLSPEKFLLLCKAIKGRPKSRSAKDVADYLDELAETKLRKDRAKLRLYLTCCLAIESETVNSEADRGIYLQSVARFLEERPGLSSEIGCFLDAVVEEAPEDDDLAKRVATVRSYVTEPSLAKK